MIRINPTMILASALSTDGCITKSHGLVCAHFLEMIPNLLFLALDFTTGTWDSWRLYRFTHKDQGKKASNLVFPISSVTNSPVQFLSRPIYLLSFFFWWYSWRSLLHYVPHWIQFCRVYNVYASFHLCCDIFPPDFEVVLSLQIK